MLFEDLHWMDSESQALLDSLIESLPTARVLLLVSYRPRIDPFFLEESVQTLVETKVLVGDRGAYRMTRALTATAYESAGIGYYHSLSVEQLGEAYLLADQVENAHACADRAVMLARGRGERGNEAWALRLMGDVVSHQARADPATAAAHYGPQ
jgi:hypothetical protein